MPRLSPLFKGIPRESVGWLLFEVVDGWRREDRKAGTFHLGGAWRGSLLSLILDIRHFVNFLQPFPLTLSPFSTFSLLWTDLFLL